MYFVMTHHTHRRNKLNICVLESLVRRYRLIFLELCRVLGCVRVFISKFWKGYEMKGGTPDTCVKNFYWVQVLILQKAKWSFRHEISMERDKFQLVLSKGSQLILNCHQLQCYSAKRRISRESDLFRASEAQVLVK